MPVTVPYPQPDQYSLRSQAYLFKIHINIIFTITPRFFKWVSPSGFPTKILYVFLFSTRRVTCRSHPINLRFMTNNNTAHPNGRAVWDVGLRPLACWDRGFESRWGHGGSSLVFIVWCVGNGLWDESWSFIQRSLTGSVYRIACDLETSKSGGLGAS